MISCPAAARQAAETEPTYPRPKIATFMQLLDAPSVLHALQIYRNQSFSKGAASLWPRALPRRGHCEPVMGCRRRSRQETSHLREESLERRISGYESES